MDFCCGWVAGAAGVLVSHPLDTLRVRVQTEPNASLSQVATRLVGEGAAGFFRGIFSPLAAVGLWKAVMFSSSEKVRAALLSSKNNESNEPPVWHAFAGGVVAGAVGLTVQVPFERVKIAAQTSAPPAAAGSVIAHEIELARQIWCREGARGLYRGTLLNASLCPLAIGVWFGVNEWLLRSLRERGRPGILEEFACGAVAGSLAWAVNFPSDKAKAIVQAAACRRPHASNWELLRPHLQAEGVPFLWRGMSATLLRALPQTGATIATYGACRRYNERWRGEAASTPR